MLFNKDITPAHLNEQCKDTLVSNLGIEFLEIGPDFLSARMPVDQRTVQPARILHGGASLALAETLGSIASHLLVGDEGKICVGMEINANHIRPVPGGWVTGTTRPLHIGKKSHIWEIKINNEENKLVCICRLTMAILEKTSN